MSAGYRPGDRVDVITRIEGATVASVGEGYIGITHSCCGRADEYTRLGPHVTVTRVAETPQAGQVWELADGTEMWIYLALNGQILARNPHEGAGGGRLDLVDWSGAVLRYPLPAPPSAPAEQPVADKSDFKGQIWYQVRPGVDSWRCRDWLLIDARPLAEVERCYGPLTDLPAVSADAEAVKA